MIELTFQDLYSSILRYAVCRFPRFTNLSSAGRTLTLHCECGRMYKL